MARRARRYVQSNIVYYLLPKLHFTFKAILFQQMAHINPAEQPCITLQTLYANIAKTIDKLTMPFLEPLLVFCNIVSCELFVSEHHGKEILGLRRDEAEARHLRGGFDDEVVVGVNGTDAKTREAEVFGEAVNDVNLLREMGAFGDYLFKADEVRRGDEAGAGVDFVADQMKVFNLDEVGEGVELCGSHGSA